MDTKYTQSLIDEKSKTNRAAASFKYNMHLKMFYYHNNWLQSIQIT